MFQVKLYITLCLFGPKSHKSNENFPVAVACKSLYSVFKSPETPFPLASLELENLRPMNKIGWPNTK